MTMPNPIVAQLKEAHKAVSRILITLAGIPKARKDLIQTGNRLSQRLVEVVASHINGKPATDGNVLLTNKLTK